MFYDNFKSEWVDNAVDFNHGRWYIKIGFCGYNSTANNRDGYITKAKAEAAILNYQNKSAYINSLR